MDFSGVLYADKDYVEVRVLPDIIYAHRKTGNLKLHVVSPVRIGFQRDERKPDLAEDVRGAHKRGPMAPQEKKQFPLIVDITGSGWRGADGYNHVGRMCEIAREGYVVACIGYRGTFKDDTTFPACIEDAKEAIRFMRAHAEEFSIDPDRVGLLGASSGGHTALFCGVTGNDERFNIGENLDQRTDVKCVIGFYAPNDMLHLQQDRYAENKKISNPGEDWPTELYEMFQEKYMEDPESYAARATVSNYIADCEKLPSFLLFTGDEDQIIPLIQGDRFCKAIRAAGGKAEFYKIVGGMHAARCWTGDVVHIIKGFLKAQL